jgi:TetR/AcrR family transcriptional regulator, mexJK operon transcriptional repressor
MVRRSTTTATPDNGDGESVRPTRGRPRDPRKREAIVESARALFFERGVEAVAMEAVAAAAGVSKMTLYALFPTKSALFEAVVHARGEALLAMFAAPRRTGAGTQDLATLLREFGTTLLSFLVQPDVRNFAAMMAMEGRRHPDLMRSFHASGPGRGLDVLAGAIAAAQARGEIEVDDPAEAAEDFFGLLQGMRLQKLDVGLPVPVDAKSIRARAERATRLFMRAFATPARPRSRRRHGIHST